MEEAFEEGQGVHRAVKSVKSVAAAEAGMAANPVKLRLLMRRLVKLSTFTETLVRV
jgi:hypothetical protein